MLHPVLIENKGKESENSNQKLKTARWTGTQTHTWKQNQNILTDTAVFLNQKRANVCEHRTKMTSRLVTPSLSCVHIHLLSSD